MILLLGIARGLAGAYSLVGIACEVGGANCVRPETRTVRHLDVSFPIFPTSNVSLKLMPRQFLFGMAARRSNTVRTTISMLPSSVQLHDGRAGAGQFTSDSVHHLIRVERLDAIDTFRCDAEGELVQVRAKTLAQSVRCHRILIDPVGAQSAIAATKGPTVAAAYARGPLGPTTCRFVACDRLARYRLMRCT